LGEQTNRFRGTAWARPIDENETREPERKTRGKEQENASVQKRPFRLGGLENYITVTLCWGRGKPEKQTLTDLVVINWGTVAKKKLRARDNKRERKAWDSGGKHKTKTPGMSKRLAWHTGGLGGQRNPSKSLDKELQGERTKPALSESIGGKKKSPETRKLQKLPSLGKSRTRRDQKGSLGGEKKRSSRTKKTGRAKNKNHGGSSDLGSKSGWGKIRRKQVEIKNGKFLVRHMERKRYEAQ